MLGLLAPTLLASLAAYVFGGSPRGVLDLRVRGWPAILAAFGLELLIYNPPIDSQPWARAVGPWLWLATKLVLLGVVALNLWVSGRPNWPWLVVGLGLALNTATIALNAGYMPQSPAAARAVWGDRVLDPNRLHNVVPTGPDTRLAWLGDNLAEPAWLPRRNVISLGDMVLSAGTAALLFVAARPTNRFPGISWNRAPLHGDART